MIGTRYKSKNYGLMEIIARETGKRYRVRFLRTGTEASCGIGEYQTGIG